MSGAVEGQGAAGDAAAGWQSFYNDRSERLNSATDDATRSHFEAELEHARVTMEAMGVTPEGGGVGEGGDVPPPAPPVPGGESTGSGDGSDYTPDGVGGGSDSMPAGDGTLSANLGAMEPYRDAILKASDYTGLDPNLIAAVIWDESKGDPGAGSVNGENGGTDSGLMQVNPDTYAGPGGLLSQNLPLSGDLSDPSEQVMAGSIYLAQNIEEFGDTRLGLRGYNSGPLSVDPSDHRISTTGYGTKNYIEKIEYFYDQLLNGETPDPAGYPGGNELY
jgi:hypothetical protein